MDLAGLRTTSHETHDRVRDHLSGEPSPARLIGHLECDRAARSQAPVNSVIRKIIEKGVADGLTKNAASFRGHLAAHATLLPPEHAAEAAADAAAAAMPWKEQDEEQSEEPAIRTRSVRNRAASLSRGEGNAALQPMPAREEKKTAAHSQEGYLDLRVKGGPQPWTTIGLAAVFLYLSYQLAACGLLHLSGMHFSRMATCVVHRAVLRPLGTLMCLPGGVGEVLWSWLLLWALLAGCRAAYVAANGRCPSDDRAAACWAIDSAGRRLVLAAIKARKRILPVALLRQQQARGGSTPRDLVRGVNPGLQGSGAEAEEEEGEDSSQSSQEDEVQW